MTPPTDLDREAAVISYNHGWRYGASGALMCHTDLHPAFARGYEDGAKAREQARAWAEIEWGGTLEAVRETSQP